uniref:SET domain-containing protein n=1 Tax=Caenorhabditis tropicalis TaxID=1561998 RepID=A0A1I7UHE3_9PELO
MVKVPTFCPNSDFPQLCDKVTVDWDKKRGRFIKATEDIPLGTVVCVEQGITVNVDIKYCYRCLTETNDNEYASRYCTECEEFYEPDEIAQGNFDHLGIFKLAAHLVFSYPFTEILDLFHRSEDPKPPQCAPSTLSTSDIESVYQLTPFPEIGETFRMKEIQNAIGTITKSLEHDANWGRLNYNSRQYTFTKALRIMAERCAKNAHTIYSIQQKENKEEDIPMGTGLFPIASIFNHSCTPNVSAFFVRNTFIFVSHGVRAGEELVDSYGVTYRQNSLPQRTEFLANVSGFKCHCQSCIENKSLDEFFEENCNTVAECAKSASSLSDIFEFTDYMVPGSKEIESLIIEFSMLETAKIYNEKMFQLWKMFLKNAKIRGIDYDTYLSKFPLLFSHFVICYLVRPYVEMTLLAWSGEVKCSESEKASILIVTHRLLKNFYAGFHPLSGIIKELVDEACKGNRADRKTIDRLKLITRSLWKHTKT